MIDPVTAVLDAEAADAASSTSTDSATRRVSPLAVFAVVGALAGIALRIYLYRTPSLISLDSDEAISGLMARHFARGELRVFFWGQQYGGTLEPALATPVLALFGASVTALKLVSTALAAVAAILTWRVGRRAVNETAGVVAGVLMWVWPATYVWWGSKARGFYWVALVLGLTLVLLAMRFADLVRSEAPNRRSVVLHAGAIGLVFGLGWWTTPQVMLFAVPVFGWLAAVAWRAWRSVPFMFAGFVVGSLPWWAANIRSGFLSLEVPPSDNHYSYLERIRIGAVDGLPIAFGGKVPQIMTWVPGGQLWFAFVAAVVVAGVVLLARRGLSTAAGVVVATLVAYLVINALSPLSFYVGDGRYLLYLMPFVTIAISAVVGAFGSRTQAVLIPVVLCIAVANTAFVLYREANAPGLKATASTSALRKALEARNLRAANADYWIAYRVTYESGERIVVVSNTFDRQPAYAAKVGGRYDAFIAVAGSAEDAALRSNLVLDRTPFERFEVDRYAVYDVRAAAGR